MTLTKNDHAQLARAVAKMTAVQQTLDRLRRKHECTADGTLIRQAYEALHVANYQARQVRMPERIDNPTAIAAPNGRCNRCEYPKEGNGECGVCP